MTAADVLQHVRAYGVEVFPDGEQLRLRAPRKPPEEVLEAVRQHRDELLAWLSRRDTAVVVVYRITDAPHLRPVVVGAPSETVDDVIDALRRRYGARLIEAREWTTRRTP